MYFITMLNKENKEITEFNTIGYISDKEEAEEKIRANDGAIFIKGDNEYYKYALLSDASTGTKIRINEVNWFQYNREEEDVEVETEEGIKIIKRVLIDIIPIEAPEGFEDYQPKLLASSN